MEQNAPNQLGHPSVRTTTVLIIAHHISTVLDYDQFVVIGKVAVVEPPPPLPLCVPCPPHLVPNQKSSNTLGSSWLPSVLKE